MTPAVTDAIPTKRPLSWRAGLVVAFACLALGGVTALDVRFVSVTHGQPVPWPIILLITMPRWILLAIALPLVLRVGVNPSPPHFRPRTIALQISLFLAISLLHAAVTAWTSGLTSPVAQLFPWSARITRAWYNTLPTVASLYGAVLLAAWGMAEARERERRTLRASQLETQLQAARLEALRAKLQPHFLYNTLNGIAALVADVQPERAVIALEHLSELLHASLRDDAREEIPVAEEVSLAERYLALQGMRFGDRLRYELRVSPDVADCLVPVLLLQPIVENAVVHGLDAGLARLQISIAAESSGETIELLVENDGTSVQNTDEPRGGASRGVGLSATRARLITAYGDRASLRLEPREGGGARVRIIIPRAEHGAGVSGQSRSGSLVVAP